MPRKKSWTVQAVLDLATNLLGDEIERIETQGGCLMEIARPGTEDEDGTFQFQLGGELLVNYVGALCKIAKEGREASDVRKVKAISDANLADLMVQEVINNPELRERVQRELQRLS